MSTMSLPLAQLFETDQYYNSEALGVAAVLVVLGVILIATSWRAFDNWIDQDTLPGLARRLFWRRVSMIIIVFFGLAIAAWMFRGPIGEAVWHRSEGAVEL